MATPTTTTNTIEQYFPYVKYNGGLATALPMYVDSDLTVTGTTTFASTAFADISATGGLSVKTGTAVPATAGAVAAGKPITMFASGPSIYVTSDAPTFTAIKGSLCLTTNGSSSSTRLFINNGTTNWVAITTAS